MSSTIAEKTRANGGRGAGAVPLVHGDRSARRLLTAGEVAELLGVPRSWVYEQSRRGRIPTVTLGRYRRYRSDAIESWIEQIEAPARGARALARHAS